MAMALNEPGEGVNQKRPRESPSAYGQTTKFGPILPQDFSAKLEIALTDKKKLTLDQFTEKVSAQAPAFARALADEDSYLQFCKMVREDLKQLRKGKAIKESEVAAALQMSQSEVSTIENGEGDIGLLTLCRYTEVLGLQPIITFAPAGGRRAGPGLNEPLVHAFILRASRALTTIAERLPREQLLAAVGAPTDAEALFLALREAAAISAKVERKAPDPLNEARLRGSAMKRDMLQAEGGVLTAQQLAEHLGITVQGLGRKRKRNQVFWLEAGRSYVYPAFQIDERGLLPGVREVLDALAVTDPWMRVNFMLTGDARLGNERPIDLLRLGRLDEVATAAEAYAEHGAA